MLCREICPSVLRSSRALAAELKARFQPQGVPIKQLDGSPHLFSTFTTGAARSSSRRLSLNLNRETGEPHPEPKRKAADVPKGSKPAKKAKKSKK